MLCHEIFQKPAHLREVTLSGEIKRVVAPKQGPVEVADTTAIVNPSPHDLARLFAKAPTLRALAEPGKFIVWPAEEELHQPVQIALNMDRRASRYFVRSSTDDDTNAVAKIGRFFVKIVDSARNHMLPQFMNKQMLAACGITADAL